MTLAHPSAAHPGAPSVDSALRAALTALNEARFDDARAAALAALELDPARWQGWFLLAQALEKSGDLEHALVAYEAAFARQPQQADIANDAGRVAFALGETQKAAQFFAVFHKARPEHAIGANNLASALRELHHFDAAIEVLRFAIRARPEKSMLWNTLGTVLSDRGDTVEARTFFEEAARLEPASAKARYNLATARLTLGDAAGALADCEAARPLAASPAEAAMIRLGRSNILLCQGRLGEGWDDYEARLDPALAAGTEFRIDRPRWNLVAPIAGKSLLVFGEQGLGDQLSFAGTIPDLLAELGPAGRLTIALEPRLVPLFRRAFPAATTIALGGTRVGARFVRDLPGFDASAADLWTPMASTLRRYRRSLADYPAQGPAFTADPARVAHWRAAMRDLPGVKVGIVWKSLDMAGARRKFFPAFEQWAPVFAAPGVSFVNLQYGESAAEIDAARRAFGVDIRTASGVDLKDDLDEVAALVSSLDLVIGPSTATTCLAAACGAPTWMFLPPASWPCQGTDGLPWYPAVKGYVAAAYQQWDRVMADIAGDLARRATA